MTLMETLDARLRLTAGVSLLWLVLALPAAIVSGGLSVLRLAHTEENYIKGRQDEQGQEGRYEKATHDSEGHWPPEDRRCNWDKA